MPGLEHKRRIDELWREFPKGGINDSLEAIEQVTFLIYSRLLDILETRDEQRRERDGIAYAPRFRENEQELRWSWFRRLKAEPMLHLVRDKVFAHLRASVASGEAVAAVMQDARLTIREPDLLAKTVDMIDRMPLDDGAEGGDLYEYLLGKLGYTGLNGQYLTPRRVVRLMVDMIAPGPEDSICDPACGTGGFLVESIKRRLACQASFRSGNVREGAHSAGVGSAANFEVDAGQGERALGMRAASAPVKRNALAKSVREDAQPGLRVKNRRDAVASPKHVNEDAGRRKRIFGRRDRSDAISGDVPASSADGDALQRDRMIYRNAVGTPPRRGGRANGAEKNNGGGERFGARRRSVEQGTCYGFDNDPSMLRFAAMNLMLQGVHAPELHYQNTLGYGFADRFPNLASECYDVVFANPPLNLRKDLKDVHPDLLPMASSKLTEFLFLSLSLRMLKQGGRAGIVVTDRALSGLGSGRRLLKELLDRNGLEAVVALPGGIIAPYRKISTAILVFCKGGRTDNVFFFDAGNDSFLQNNGRGSEEKDVLRECLASWKNRDPKKDRDRGSNAFFVSAEEIRDAGYDLSVYRYKEIAYEPEYFEPPRKILGQMNEIEKDIARDLSELDGMLR